MEEDFYTYETYDPAYSGDVEAMGAAFGAIMCVYYIFIMVLVAVMMVSMWKMFVKAGKPGWAAIVPVYNIIVLLEIVGKPAWWVILFFIPVVNLVASILVYIEIAKAFGKGTGFAVGMVLLPYVFFPMLGFGSAKYQGVSAPATQVAPPAEPQVV